jgi:hypothetical protein
MANRDSYGWIDGQYVDSAVIISKLERQRILEILDETKAFLEAAVMDGLADEKITKEFDEVYAILGVQIDER